MYNEYNEAYFLDATYLILFCGLFLRSSELVFRRLHRRRHGGFDLAIALQQKVV